MERVRGLGQESPEGHPRALEAFVGWSSKDLGVLLLPLEKTLPKRAPGLPPFRSWLGSGWVPGGLPNFTPWLPLAMAAWCSKTFSCPERWAYSAPFDVERPGTEPDWNGFCSFVLVSGTPGRGSWWDRTSLERGSILFFRFGGH